jgi:hypothetical protein
MDNVQKTNNGINMPSSQTFRSYEKFCSQFSTYTWDLGRQMCHSDSEGLEHKDFQTVLRAAGETETKQENIQDWLELDEGGPGFQLLTEEEIAADVIKNSAMEEDANNELDELQESTIKKKLLNFARDGIDAVINYVDSSTNKKFQEYYEHQVEVFSSTIVTHTRQHACNICEAFSLKCWFPSSGGHQWPEHVKA